MLKIYGSPRTSAGRCFSMLEEIGATYEAASVDMAKREHKSPEYLKLNPNGKVPCLVDGDFVIWESMAINSYLAEKYKPELLGTGVEEKSLVTQWSVWGMMELQPPLVDLLIQTVFMPEERRDQALIEKRRAQIPAKLEILDQALKGKEYLLGGHYTLADLNLVSIVRMATSTQVDLSPYKNIVSWFERINSRPSFQHLTKISSH